MVSRATRLARLTLTSRLAVLFLEIVVVFERGGPVIRSGVTYCLQESFENRVWEKSNLVICNVIVNAVKSGNDAASVIKLLRLLHVVICLGIGATLRSLSPFLIVLSIEDEGDTWLGNEAEQIFFESVELREDPVWRQTHLRQVVGEYLWVRLERGPLVSLLVCRLLSLLLSLVLGLVFFLLLLCRICFNHFIFNLFAKIGES